VIQSITLTNYLSFEQETVTFGSDTVAVVGDNGQGKSSLLEAIAFALYGVGRYKSLGSLVRIGSSEMAVSIVLSGLPMPSDTMEVVRGYSVKKEAGHLTVTVNGSVVAKGGASPANNRAQEYINGTLGVDATTFMLTSFFGLGGADSLMRVGPSEKLETLQRLAGASACRDINAEAVKEQRQYEGRLQAEERALEVFKGMLPDVDDLDGKRESIRDTLRRASEAQVQLSLRRDDLVARDSKRSAMLARVMTIQGLRSEVAANVQRNEDRMVKVQQRIAAITADISAVRGVLCDAAGVDVDALQDRLDTARAEKSALLVEVRLLQASSDVQATECPLCGGPLSDGIRDAWGSRVDALTERVDSLSIEESTLVNEIKTVRDADAKRRSLETKSALLHTELSGYVKQREEIEDEQVRLVNLRTAYDRELDAVGDELKELPDLSVERESVDKDLSRVVSSIAELQSELKHIQAEIARVDQLRGKIELVTSEVNTLRKLVRATALVAEAFSRYAIPLEMLRRLRADLEARASDIYRNFTSGSIVIRDTAGARPGVEFVLVDGNGEREYSGLSEGEKVMFSLAVRVAVTQRENKARDSKVDFLVLDEVSGHLSPAKRDSLTLVIQTILKKYFRQIFMVSHVPMRDIFSRTLEVAKVGGVSRVSVT